MKRDRPAPPPRFLRGLLEGGFPSEAATIDHVDRNPANNRWANLRPATYREQTWNQRVRRKNNTSGFRGVIRSGGRWRAGISKDGVTHHLGVFDTLGEAVAAYEAKARELHGEFYREPEYLSDLRSRPKRSNWMRWMRAA